MENRLGRIPCIGEHLRNEKRDQHFKNKKPCLASGFTKCAEAARTDNDPYPLEQEVYLLERDITTYRETISNLENETSVLSSKSVATSVAQTQSQSQSSPEHVNFVVEMANAAAAAETETSE